MKQLLQAYLYPGQLLWMHRLRLPHLHLQLQLQQHNHLRRIRRVAPIQSIDFRMLTVEAVFLVDQGEEGGAEAEEKEHLKVSIGSQEFPLYGYGS